MWLRSRDGWDMRVNERDKENAGVIRGVGCHWIWVKCGMKI